MHLIEYEILFILRKSILEGYFLGICRFEKILNNKETIAVGES